MNLFQREKRDDVIREEMIWLKVGITMMALGLFGMIGFGTAGMEIVSMMSGLVLLCGFTQVALAGLWMMWYW